MIFNSSKTMGYRYPEVINGQIMNAPNSSALRSITDGIIVTPQLTHDIKTDSLVSVTSEEDDRDASRSQRQLDLNVAASGYGHDGYYCPEGIPVETALFALLAASAIAFGVLFMAITQITGKRKKREANRYDYTLNETEMNYSVMFSSLLWQGMSLSIFVKFYFSICMACGMYFYLFCLNIRHYIMWFNIAIS